MAWTQILKSFTDRHPNLKKIIGVVFIILGLVALVTPFTPGSWLVFVGLELLGFRIALWDRFKSLFKKS